MQSDKRDIKKLWHEVKATSGFRKLLTFLVFVFIAALFWFILALNDNIQDDFEVRVNIYNVPDTVTFINLPPEKIHVMVRDKGTSLWRNGVFARPAININFRDYSRDGLFRMTRSELNAGLKNVFGTSATLLSASVDSLHLTYTTLPGKRLPVSVNGDFTPAVGKVISSLPISVPKNVTVYGTSDVLDTLSRVMTQRVTRHNLEESSEIMVALAPISGARFEPASVTVKLTVEPLVRKQTNVNIQIDNVPDGYDLLLFPSNVNVEYYVPMSIFSGDNQLVEARVDYRDLADGKRKLPIRIGRHSSNLVNINLLTDSVEYTLVRN